MHGQNHIKEELYISFGQQTSEEKDFSVLTSVTMFSTGTLIYLPH